MPSRRSTSSPTTRNACGVSGGIAIVSNVTGGGEYWVSDLVLAPVGPRLRNTVEDVQDLDVRVLVHGRRVAGLGRLDPGAHGRRALVIADDELVVRERAEADTLGLLEADDGRLFHDALLVG